jgi:DOPA 4,5-dioxygenase
LGIKHATYWVIGILFYLNSIRSFIEFRPHPIGSWGIYLPLEQFTEAASFVSMYHGNLTILLHPNSGHPKIDHLLNAYWIKSFVPLDGRSISIDDDSSIFVYILGDKLSDVDPPPPHRK